MVHKNKTYFNIETLKYVKRHIQSIYRAIHVPLSTRWVILTTVPTKCSDSISVEIYKVHACSYGIAVELNRVVLFVTIVSN